MLGGLVPGLGGRQKSVHVFWGGHFFWPETEKQPKHKVFGQDIPRTSISGRTSRPKNFHPIARSAGK